MKAVSEGTTPEQRGDPFLSPASVGETICEKLHRYARTSIMNTLKAVVWMGSSKDDLIAFPADARREAGYQLESVQRGGEPQDWKPMSSVGPGVREIRIREPSGAFRVMYLATRPEAIYVLHCFQKKSQQTSRQDLALAKARLKAVSTAT